MALIPGIDGLDLEDVEEQSSKTYKLDFETGRISGYIDELEAVKQFILKSLITTRYKNPIYDDQYGNEFEELLSGNFSDELLEAEFQRLASEAIDYDSRILSVNSATASISKDGIFMTIDVSTIYGDTNVSFNLNKYVEGDADV